PSLACRTSFIGLYLCHTIAHVFPLPTRYSRLPYATRFRSRDLGAIPRRDPQPLAGAAKRQRRRVDAPDRGGCAQRDQRDPDPPRSEEHTSELQSRENLVCRLLREK